MIINLSIVVWIASKLALLIVKGIRVRTMDDCVWSLVYRPGLRSRFSNKPLVPALETPVRLRFINIVVIIVDELLDSLAKPSMRLFLIHIF